MTDLIGRCTRRHLEHAVDRMPPEEGLRTLLIEPQRIVESRGPYRPDILANAGGVVVSYLEWIQNRRGDAWPRERVLEDLEARMEVVWQGVRDRAARDENLPP